MIFFVLSEKEWLMQQHLHVSRNKYKQNKRVKIHVSGVVYSGEDTWLRCFPECVHSGQAEVCLTTVGIEPATFGYLVQ